MTTLLLVLAVLAVAVFLVMKSQQRGAGNSATQLDDAKADARQAIERLGGQVYNLTGSDDPSRQALADAAERYTAAGSQIDQAATPVQARLAKQTALEGLYYIRAARVAMGMDPGPEIPTIDGQKSAGAVTEAREVEFEGRKVAASPTPSTRTPNYYPGGRVAGRPVPAGWYSEPWWKPALVAGAWGMGSMLLFSSMFSGMAGVPYNAQEFEAGGDSNGGDSNVDQDINSGDPGADQNYDQGGTDYTDGGSYDGGFDGGGFDGGGFDGGGMDF